MVSSRLTRWEKPTREVQCLRRATRPPGRPMTVSVVRERGARSKGQYSSVEVRCEDGLFPRTARGWLDHGPLHADEVRARRALSCRRRFAWSLPSNSSSCPTSSSDRPAEPSHTTHRRRTDSTITTSRFDDAMQSGHKSSRRGGLCTPRLVLLAPLQASEPRTSTGTRSAHARS
jgi:hypothetical protein